MADAQNPNDELYPIAVLMDELKVANPARPLAPRLLKSPDLPASDHVCPRLLPACFSPMPYEGILPFC